MLHHDEKNETTTIHNRRRRLRLTRGLRKISMLRKIVAGLCLFALLAVSADALTNSQRLLLLGSKNANVIPAAPPPLDGISTGLIAAYSTRKLLTAYAGNAIRVQRASDSTQSDIGFAANVLNTGTLGAFCASTSCKVVTWYDQSGGGFDMTPGTAPTIYASGAVKVINGKPAILFTGANSENLTNASLNPNPTTTRYQNSVVSATLSQTGAIAGGTISQSLEWQIGQTTGNIALNAAGVANLGNSTSTLSASVGAVIEVSYTLSTGVVAFFFNGAAAGTATTMNALSAGNPMHIGGQVAPAEYFDGLIGEYIAYDLVGGIPSASRISIAANQKAYWGTP